MIIRIKDEALVESLRKNVSELKELINQCDINILSVLKICLKLTVFGFYGVYSNIKSPEKKRSILMCLGVTIEALELEKQCLIKNKSFEEFIAELDKITDGTAD